MDYAMNIPDKEVKMICPCCGKEIIVVINDIQNFSNDNELKKILNKVNNKQLIDKNIEFGILNKNLKE